MRYFYFLLTLLTLLLVSCGKEKMNEKTTTMENNQQLIKKYFSYFNQHEWTAMANMYSQTAEFKDPSLGSGIFNQSRQEISDKYAELQQIFPDLHDEVVKIYPSGENHIIVEFISSGTAADETQFELAICTIFTIENGLITQDFTYYDNFEEEENK